MAISIDPRNTKKQNTSKKATTTKKTLSSKKATDTNKSGLQTPGRSAKLDK